MKSKKKTSLGQYFTPDFIVERMLSLRKFHRRALEPSAGDGAFLSKLDQNAVGVEVDESLLDDTRLWQGDFFSFPKSNKFETIIGNPPYVRYRDIATSTKEILPMELFDKRSNLYLFFIAKCIEHLKTRGELIFITPRDFLKATSAINLNEHLYKYGSMTHYYELGDTRVFKDATPNCAIWRWEKGRKSRKMITGGSFCCKNGQIWFGGNSNLTELADFFEIKVGAVSGADDVFTSEKYGETSMVCSETVNTRETRKMIYNKKHRSLNKHKDRLLNRKMKNFNQDNWWEWGRKFCQR